jgi:hypothetical protein
LLNTYSDLQHLKEKLPKSIIEAIILSNKPEK